MINIITELFELQDGEHKIKRCSAIPSLDPNNVIGVKYADLHKLGDRIFKCGETPDFMSQLPHKYFEENCLHAYFINKIGCFDECVAEIVKFVPYIDNWFVCDLINPSTFRKYPDDTFYYVCDWICSEIPFAQRIGINTMANVFSQELYDKSHIRLINNIVTDDYYVKLAKIRYFAELLIYHYDDMIMYIYLCKLDTWIHNETINKCLKSSRIPQSVKSHLSQLKIK